MGMSVASRASASVVLAAGVASCGAEPGVEAAASDAGESVTSDNQEVNGSSPGAYKTTNRLTYPPEVTWLV